MSYRKRTVYLILGQVVSAIGIVGMVQANIGLDPWNCLHQGLSNISGLSFGICTILVGSCAIFIYFLLRFVRMIIATTAAARIIPITTRIIPIIPLASSIPRIWLI